jgi:hypothetical protein
MMRRMTFLVLGLTALFVLQFADCFSPVSADEQTMQCCGSMPCNPSNQSHDCCKTMTSAQSPSFLPVKHSVLSVPVVAVIDHLSTRESVVFAEVSRSRFNAPQYSPPELYTLHSSLLI